MGVAHPACRLLRSGWSLAWTSTTAAVTAKPCRWQPRPRRTGRAWAERNIAHSTATPDNAAAPIQNRTLTTCSTSPLSAIRPVNIASAMSYKTRMSSVVEARLPRACGFIRENQGNARNAISLRNGHDQERCVLVEEHNICSAPRPPCQCCQTTRSLGTDLLRQRKHSAPVHFRKVYRDNRTAVRAVFDKTGRPIRRHRIQSTQSGNEHQHRLGRAIRFGIRGGSKSRARNPLGGASRLEPGFWSMADGIRFASEIRVLGQSEDARMMSCASCENASISHRRDKGRLQNSAIGATFGCKPRYR